MKWEIFLDYHNTPRYVCQRAYLSQKLRSLNDLEIKISSSFLLCEQNLKIGIDTFNPMINDCKKNFRDPVIIWHSTIDISQLKFQALEKSKKWELKFLHLSPKLSSSKSYDLSNKLCYHWKHNHCHHLCRIKNSMKLFHTQNLYNFNRV